MMEWSIVLLSLKLVSYFAVSALAGTLVLRLINNHSKSSSSISPYYGYLRRWLLPVLLAGFVASLLQIPIEAGALAESGLVGMSDTFMLEIAWQSAIGEQAVYRVSCFLIAIIAAYFWQIETRPRFSVNYLISLTALVAIAYSFTMTGHNASEGILTKLVLVFHILAIASWVGALWPLYKSCNTLTVVEVKSLMHRFGQAAIAIVLVLIAAGITLLNHTLGSITQLFTTNYGQLILFKLLLVSSMLMLGAWHKLKLVPEITENKHVSRLKYSIAAEMCIALIVFVTTSIFTTLVGPTT